MKPKYYYVSVENNNGTDMLYATYDDGKCWWASTAGHWHDTPSTAQYIRASEVYHRVSLRDVNQHFGCVKAHKRLDTPDKVGTLPAT